MTERTTVVLVDEAGRVLGATSKLDAHRPPGKLHLAFSVLLFRPDGHVLLQRRALGKYHFPGVWANACCSHPLPGEDLVASAERRLVEELGVSCCVTPVGAFVYRAVCEKTGLVEHELDHVLVGTTRDEPAPAPSEVAATCWVDPSHLLGGAFSAGNFAADDAQPAADGPSGGAPPRLAPWLLPALELALGTGRR